MANTVLEQINRGPRRRVPGQSTGAERDKVRPLLAKYLPYPFLSDKQQKIVSEWCGGHGPSAISVRLGIGYGTVTNAINCAVLDFLEYGEPDEIMVFFSRVKKGRTAVRLLRIAGIRSLAQLKIALENGEINRIFNIASSNRSDPRKPRHFQLAAHAADFIPGDFPAVQRRPDLIEAEVPPEVRLKRKEERIRANFTARVNSAKSRIESLSHLMNHVETKVRKLHGDDAADWLLGDFRKKKEEQRDRLQKAERKLDSVGTGGDSDSSD